jgi:NitT/TauT family transport system permease protein
LKKQAEVSIHAAEAPARAGPPAAAPADIAGSKKKRKKPGRIRQVVRVALPPTLLAILVLAGWTYASDHLLKPSKRFLLPSPLQVFRVGMQDPQNREEILKALASTAKVALVGLAISMVLGVLIAVLMSQARWVERAIYPYAVILQTIPILAVVPLIGYWWGFNFRSRVLVVILISIFPIITNTLFGLRSVDSGLHDLFSLHRVSRVTRLRKLELPAAVPAMFTGFRISAGLGVIGAIVADFFFRQGDPGIGRLIDVYRQRLATEQLMMAVLLSSLLGVIMFFAFGWLAKKATGNRARPASRS